MDILVTTITGCQDILADEMRELGFKSFEVERGGVRLNGDLKDLYKLNYCLRTASKVLIQVYQGHIQTPEDISKKAYGVNWEDYFPVDTLFIVENSVNQNKQIKNDMIVNMLVKDGIVDRFRKKFNDRPSVSKDEFEIKVFAYILKNNMTLYLDSSGLPLYRRNYKQDLKFIAPIKEHLAAIILRHMEYNPGMKLIDPMCGSATILTEASLMASSTPPGYLRNFYSFLYFKNFDKEIFAEVKEEANSKITEIPQLFQGFDKDRYTIITMNNTVQHPIFQKSIQLDIKNIRKLDEDYSCENGLIFINPPYGKRLDTEKNLDLIYKDIGDKLKNNFKGNTAYILTGNLGMIKKIQLRSEKKIKIMNGPLECRLVKYSLF
ncbi:hypothetical protein KAJ27_14020 [bacterium]|nr:hypothetical protein [bacterium]